MDALLNTTSFSGFLSEISLSFSPGGTSGSGAGPCPAAISIGGCSPLASARVPAALPLGTANPYSQVVSGFHAVHGRGSGGSGARVFGAPSSTTPRSLRPTSSAPGRPVVQVDLVGWVAPRLPRGEPTSLPWTIPGSSPLSGGSQSKPPSCPPASAWHLACLLPPCPAGSWRSFGLCHRHASPPAAGPADQAQEPDASSPGGTLAAATLRTDRPVHHPVAKASGFPARRMQARRISVIIADVSVFGTRPSVPRASRVRVLRVRTTVPFNQAIRAGASRKASHA